MSIEMARGIGDDAISAMNDEIKELMARAAIRASAEVHVLDVGADGRISPTRGNILKINVILDKIGASLFDEQYVDAVADYLEGLDEVSGAVSKTLRNLGADDELMSSILDRSKAAAISLLLDRSSFRDLFGSIAAQLTNGIIVAARASDIVDAVRVVVRDSGIDAGAKSQADSIPAAMQRAQTAAASEQAGIMFYRFQGRSIPTTRPWCLEREGHVFHVEEIREWGRMAAAGRGWDGMIEGTNEQTIFTYLGGWYGNRAACRHVLIPVLPSRIPVDDMNRMRAAGLID